MNLDWKKCTSEEVIKGMINDYIEEKHGVCILEDYATTLFDKVILPKNTKFIQPIIDILDEGTSIFNDFRFNSVLRYLGKDIRENEKLWKDYEETYKKLINILGKIKQNVDNKIENSKKILDLYNE